MIYIILITVLILIDQITKWLIVKNFYYSESIPVIENFFHITYVRNQGIAFGFLQGKLHIISWLTLVAVIFLGIFLFRHLKEAPILEKCGYFFIFSGAVGNLIDRVFRNYVVDMIDFRGLWVYVFNFADVWINIGVILIIIDSIVRRNKK